MALRMRLTLIAVVLALLLGAAGGPVAGKASRLLVGFAGVRQLTYAATLIALERMRDRGYEAPPVFFPRPELALQALLRGEVDLVRTDPTGPAHAVARGAQVAIVAAPGLNQWVLVTPRTITAPRQLDRKRIAVHSLSSMSNTVVQFAVRRHRIAAPQILVIPGSPARAQALLRGEVDATSLFLTDAIRLDLTAPGRFHILLDFKDLPVLDTVLVARREWLADHPQEIRDVLRVLLDTHRRIAAGPEWAVVRTLQLFPDEDRAFVEATVRAFVARGIWDVNGGIPGYRVVREMIAFLKSIEALPPSAPGDPEAYADLTPLQDVLRVLGRR